MSALLMQAAQSAAQADGLLPPPLPDGTGSDGQGGGGGGMSKASAVALQQARSAIAAHHHQQQQQQHSNAAAAVAAAAAAAAKKKGPPLRRGKWTPEEEAYANRLIQEFKAGLLPLTDGTTLRTFLSKLLNCDPMRISKKFVGSNCIGKQVFRRRNADLNRLTPDQIQKSRAELSELERRFLERVAQTNRVKSGVGSPTGATPPTATNTTAPAGAGGAGNNTVVGGMNNGNNNAGMYGNNNGLTPNNNNNNNNNPLLNALQQQRQDLDDGSAMGGGGGGMNGLNANALLFGNQNAGMNAGGGGAPPSPPWLQPPLGYKSGTGAAFAAANLSTANSRAAAAGRALLEGNAAALKEALERKQQQNQDNNNNNNGLNGFGGGLGGFGNTNNNNNNNNSGNSSASWGSSAMLAELQKRASATNFGGLMSNMGNSGNSASNLLAAAQSGNNAGFSSNTLSQLAQNASAARLAGLASQNSMSNLMLKTGLSREQISQLARDHGISSGSLSNMIQRQNSFDALMSLDFQSLQSIDNLANLMQTGSSGVAGVGHLPESGFKNADFGSAASRPNFGATSNEDLSTAVRRLASAGRMESLLKSMSSSNSMGGIGAGSGNHAGSSANFSNLLQSMQGNAASASASNLFGAGSGQSAVSLANLLRQDSSTGLTALRMQDGLNQRNSSVDDFLSLVAAGDIPHQDPSLLNVPLVQQQQQNQGAGSNNSQEAAAKLLAQQQMLSGNAALANALVSRSLGSFQGFGQNNGGGASAAQLQALSSSIGSKRKLDDLGDFMGQGPNKH